MNSFYRRYCEHYRNIWPLILLKERSTVSLGHHCYISVKKKIKNIRKTYASIEAEIFLLNFKPFPSIQEAESTLHNSCVLVTLVDYKDLDVRLSAMECKTKLFDKPHQSVPLNSGPRIRTYPFSIEWFIRVVENIELLLKKCQRTLDPGGIHA